MVRCGLFLSEDQQPLFPSRITLSLGIRFPRNFACLQIMKTNYYSHPISHTSVSHFLHHHCHCPLLLLSLFHSRLKTHLFHKSSPPWFFYLSSHRTDLTDSSCFFLFFSGMSALTLACTRLSTSAH